MVQLPLPRLRLSGLLNPRRQNVVKLLLDFGCGEGGWLSIWKQRGVKDYIGVDGQYVDQTRLLIERERFVAADLRRPVDLGRRFDMVQSLEVAEHLEKASAEIFVETLTRHGDMVLFSAAVPGQGGVNHVNERPYEYWRRLFSERGFSMYDPLRPALLEHHTVEPWYRYNTFLYVHESRAGELPDDVRARRVPPEVAVPDLSPWSYRLRRAMLRPLPCSVVTCLARLRMATLTMLRRT